MCHIWIWSRVIIVLFHDVAGVYSVTYCYMHNVYFLLIEILFIKFLSDPDISYKHLVYFVLRFFWKMRLIIREILFDLSRNNLEYLEISGFSWKAFSKEVCRRVKQIQDFLECLIIVYEIILSPKSSRIFLSYIYRGKILWDNSFWSNSFGSNFTI